MRTQSIDTSPEAERVQIAILRRKGVRNSFRITTSMSDSLRVAALLARQQQQPGLTEQEAMFAATERSLGRSLATELRQIAVQRQIVPSFSTIELKAAFVPVVQALEQMNIPCALTGSFARSVYGMQRTLVQVDVLANLEHTDTVVLQELLPAPFYVRLADIQLAKAQRTPLTYYHLPSLFPIRVAFPQKDLDELSMLTRVRHLTLLEEEPDLPLLAPEDVSVLALVEIRQEMVELARRGRKEEPDDLWNELLGVLKVQGPELDLQLIERQARRFGLLSLMQRAFEDVGLHETIS